MPVMDGKEATRRIKHTEAGQSTKVIAVTAHALEDERREILAAGCDDFIRKPYRDSEIFDALAKHLGIRYRYSNVNASASETSTSALDANQLRRLPRHVTEDLLRAAQLLEGHRILDVIDHISELDRGLGERLRRMAENLQYKELLEVLDGLRERAVS